jgi:hypothetical protein
MMALANASQTSTTSRRRSVHQRSPPYWLPQAWVRSVTHRWLAGSRHRPQRDATGLGDHRALEALLAAVDRAGPGGLAAAGRLGDAAVHRQLLQLQAEQLVVGDQDRSATPAVIHSSRRRRRVVAEQPWSAILR